MFFLSVVTASKCMLGYSGADFMATDMFTNIFSSTEKEVWDKRCELIGVF